MHYLLPLFVPPLLLLAIGRHDGKRRNLLSLTVLSAVLMYAVTVSSAFATSAWYSHQAESYDKNGDGVISLEEQSPSQSAAMDLATNDAGRNLTVLLGAVWAVVVSAVFFGAVGLVRFMALRRKAAIALRTSELPSNAVRLEPDA
jgi:hypothetical protein